MAETVRPGGKIDKIAELSDKIRITKGETTAEGAADTDRSVSIEEVIILTKADTSIASAITNDHTHSNKATLDDYTQTEVDLADAVSKKHIQNSDTILDEGNVNEVTAAALRVLLDTALYNNVWTPPPGGAILNGIDQKYDLTNQTGVQCITLIVNNLSISTTTELAFLGTNLEIDAISGTITLGSTFANATVYVDNAVTTTYTVASKLILIVFDAVSVVSGFIGSDGVNFGAFHLIEYSHWNLQPDSDLRNDIWNNGQPHLAKIEFKYQGATQTALTSGLLKIGKEYIIDTYVAGDDFDHTGITIVSGTINTTGCVFIPAETTPTIWTNSSSLRHQGDVLNISFNNWGTNGAMCELDSELIVANSTGSPISVDGLFDGRGGIAATPVNLITSQKDNRTLEKIRIKNDGASTGVWKVGTATGLSNIGSGSLSVAEKYDTIVVNEFKGAGRDIWVEGDAATTMTFFLIYKKEN